MLLNVYTATPGVALLRCQENRSCEVYNDHNDDTNIIVQLSIAFAESARTLIV